MTFELLAHPHISMSYVNTGFIMNLYIITLFPIDRLDFRCTALFAYLSSFILLTCFIQLTLMFRLGLKYNS